MEIIFNTMTVVFATLFALSIWGVVGSLIVRATGLVPISMHSAVLLAIFWPITVFELLYNVIEKWIREL